MSWETILSRMGRLSAEVFLPMRRLFGPLHRRRGTFDEEIREHEAALPPLPPEWRQDDRWYAGSFPPRRHNALHPLLHGNEYFRDLCRELRAARSRVTIAAWCLTPLMALLRGEEEDGSIVARVLDEASTHAEVLVLLWSGAPALFQPDLQLVKRVRQTLRERAPRVRCELDGCCSFGHDHHQKGITVDGRVAYVGGIDLSTFQGDRWDTREHRLRFGPNWHDVQMRLEGEVVRDVEENFCQRWNAVTGERLQPLTPAPVDAHEGVAAQIVRTIPAGFYPFAPDGEYGIRHALLAGIGRAQRFIYLENQYLWAPRIVDSLVEAMNRPHDGPFRVVIVLPARAYLGKYDNDEHVRTLREADAGRGIFAAYTPYASGPASGMTGYRYLPIYVHAKVAIVDDEWLTVGSANLNRRGMAGDTEMNVQAVAPHVARELRIRLWSEHLGMPEDEVRRADPIALIDGPWKRTADELTRHLEAGDMPSIGHVIHYTPGTNPGSRILDVIQALTLEH